MTESNTMQLWNGVQDVSMLAEECDEDRKSLKSLPPKIHSGFPKILVATGRSNLDKHPLILDVLTSDTDQYRTHRLTTQAELGLPSPPGSHSHSSSPSRSPSQPRLPQSPWPPPSWAQPHPPHQRQDVDLEWIFVITNFVLEIPSAVFDQLSSPRKPLYALLSMVMSFAALVICVVELVYTCQKQKVVWRWKGTLPWPWFYYRSRNRPFGNFKHIIGLVCALCQCIFAAVNYSFARQHADPPLKICFWPLVFAFGLLCSKRLAK